MNDHRAGPAEPEGRVEREPIRIANCSGFFGDRLDAASEMVDGGPIDVLTGDWLAELTMYILSRVRAKRPGAGYAGTFLTQMEQVMGTCLDRGIRVVSNAGGLDPAACAEQVTEIGARLGLEPAVAVVTGDDLMPRLCELVEHDRLLDSAGRPLDLPLDRVVTANAYLGCWGIVEALDRGADIVITGRVTDAALVCGPAAWYHGWARDAWDELAGAVVAGHVIECGAQATGGNYSFVGEIEEPLRPGFPWAEVAADGSAVIGKHPGTGGEVSIGTVTSQVLYEIHGPSYLGPDVTARFDTIDLTQLDRDLVRVSGVRGGPPPPTLKVAINSAGGYRNEMSVALTGLDVEAKAAMVERSFWDACPVEREQLDDVVVELSRTDRSDPATNEEATAVLRIVASDADADLVGRRFSNAMAEIALASVPGLYLLSGSPGPAVPFGLFRAAYVDRDLVAPRVTVSGEVAASGSARRGSALVAGAPGAPAAPAAGSDDETASTPPGPEPSGPASSPSGADHWWLAPEVTTCRLPLGALVGARSGDKGGDANLGVFSRTPDVWEWLDWYLTVDRLRRLLPEIDDLDVERHRFPRLWSLNFVIHGLLQDGAASAIRIDAQAKSLGEWFRARVVDVPVDLVVDRGTDPGE